MADVRKLKQEAAQASENGNWRKAANCYANLEKDDPGEPAWALKLGETLRRLGHDQEAVKALGRAVDAYARSGLELKAIAVCKVILSIDPKHTATLERLPSLQAMPPKPPDPDTPPPATVPRAQGSGERPAFSPSAPQRPASGERRALPSGERPLSPERPRVPTPAPPTRLSPLAPQPEPWPARSASLPPPTLARAPDPLSDPQISAPLLSGLRLAARVSGARPSPQIPAPSGSAAMEIPLDDDFVTERSVHKGAGQRTMATFVLPKTAFFSVLSPELLRLTVERIRLIQLAAGEVLFSRGDPGDALYVVAWGEIAVLVPQEVARLSEGEFFGEIALITNRPRTATVRATVESKVLAIDRPLLNHLISASPSFLVVLLRFVRERLIATLAETNPLFAPFTPLERLGLTARFQFLDVDDGLQIVTEGQKSPGLFVILTGETTVSVAGKVLARLESGDVVGEISLVATSVSTATVTCVGTCFVLFLPRADFAELMMTHPQVLEYVSSIAQDRIRDQNNLGSGDRLSML
jgi:CRP-like cAMP-binding protein